MTFVETVLAHSVQSKYSVQDVLQKIRYKDGEISFGKIKRGNREITVTSKTGEIKKYLVPLSKQILVQENDYIKAGTSLSVITSYSIHYTKLYR